MNRRPPPEFVRRIVELARAGRRVTEIARELELDEPTIYRWLKQAKVDAGEQPGLTTDEKSEFASVAFGLRCREVGVEPSMGSVGDAYDNAICESVFATLECELLDRRRFKTHAEVDMAIFDFHPTAVTPRSTTSRQSSTNDRQHEARFSGWVEL